MTFDLTEQEQASVAAFSPDQRTIALFADAGATDDAHDLARSTGARVLGPHPLDRAGFADRVLGDLAMVEVSRDGGAALDRFLDGLDAAARAGQLPVVCAVTPELIDIVAARLCAPTIILLANATLVDRIAALGAAGIARRDRLQDVRGDTMRLQRLTDEVARIARALADLAEAEPGPPSALADGLTGYRAPPPVVAAAPSVAVGARDVRAIIRLRRLRERYFLPDLFADPAWDILLDLMAARLERTPVAVSSLCIAAAVPPTTALRWIKSMTEAELLVRVADPTDARRVFIELSERAAAAMLGYLDAAKGQDGLAV